MVIRNILVFCSYLQRSQSVNSICLGVNWLVNQSVYPSLTHSLACSLPPEVPPSLTHSLTHTWEDYSLWAHTACIFLWPMNWIFLSYPGGGLGYSLGPREKLVVVWAPGGATYMSDTCFMTISETNKTRDFILSYLTQISLIVQGKIGFSLITRWCHVFAKIVFVQYLRE